MVGDLTQIISYIPVGFLTIDHETDHSKMKFQYKNSLGSWVQHA